MITYTWIFSAADVTYDGQGAVEDCNAIHWRRNAVDESDNAGSVYGVEAYGDSFTIMSALTQASLEAWIEGVLDVTAIDAELAAAVNEQETPTHATVPLNL